MARKNQAEIEAWLSNWPIGKQGIFGGRHKEEVKVVGVEWNRGFPTLELRATTGHVYYCLYGARKYLHPLFPF